jgi:hypothetical protein
MLAKLNDDRLTGMTSAELASLAAALAPLQAARAQQRHSAQRGGRARRAAGKVRAKPLFDDRARVQLTLLYPAASVLYECARRPARSHRHLHR